MKVNVAQEDQVTVVRPAGKLDAETAPLFQEAVGEALQNTSQRVVIDMNDVPYVSSAGLRVFIRIAKEIMGSGKLAVCGLSSNVQQIFELAGFDKIMAMCGDLEAAKQSV